MGGLFTYPVIAEERDIGWDLLQQILVRLIVVHSAPQPENRVQYSAIKI